MRGGAVHLRRSTFGHSIHPSRGVLLASQVAFALSSLLTRRVLGQVVQTQAKRSCFLVLGAGETARHFYRSNLAASNRQPLRFVDPALSGPTDSQRASEETNSDALVIEHLAFGEFADLLAESCGVVLTTEGGQIPAALTDWLTRLYYEYVPVYMLETFCERHWRRVPTYAIDPSWPLQVGTQLVSSSPYSHARRLFDIVVAGLELHVLAPVFGLLAPAGARREWSARVLLPAAHRA